jgi:hypothetical protein
MSSRTAFAKGDLVTKKTSADWYALVAVELSKDGKRLVVTDPITGNKQTLHVDRLKRLEELPAFKLCLEAPRVSPANVLFSFVCSFFLFFFLFSCFYYYLLYST